MDPRRRLADRFVSLLEALGGGKLRDGHWPITPWEATPGVARALASFGEVYDSGPLALPWAPTAFLNLYYCASLAYGWPELRGVPVDLPISFLEGFRNARMDELANRGVTSFRAQDPDRLAQIDCVMYEGSELGDVFGLCAAVTASGEGMGWSLHRMHSEFHGPYLATSGRSYLVQSFDLDTFVRTADHRMDANSKRLHIWLQISQKALPEAGLDFFGHLGTSLCQLADAAAVTCSDHGVWWALTIEECGELRRQLEQHLLSQVQRTNALSQVQLCAGFGRRFLAACLCAAAVDEHVSSELLRSFPAEIEALSPWEGTRAEFLQYLRNAAR